jgi:cytidylate kinase
MPIITISRGTRSGGEALANSLSEKLGISAISREILKEASLQFGVSEAALNQQLEKTKGLVHGPSPERTLYMAAIQLVLAEHAEQGSFIYHGHAGHFLLRGIPHLLNVRIIAPLKYRAQNLMKLRNISFQEAAKMIERMDEDRIKWTRFLYNVDWRDPALYHLVINLEYMSLDTASEIIISTLNQPEFRDTVETQKMVKDFALATRVKVRLATHDRTKGLDLEVGARDGKIKITGSFLTSGIFARGKHTIKDDLRRVTKEVNGVKEVEIVVKDVAVPLE